MQPGPARCLWVMLLGMTPVARSAARSARSAARNVVAALAGVVVALGVVAGCGCAGELPRIPDKGGADALVGRVDARFRVHDPAHQDWRDRSFLLHLPEGYDNGDAVPVVVAIHGGGGNADGMLALTCKPGDDSTCLRSLADREGFAVVVPEGTPAHLFHNHRTWNSGGQKGHERFRCVSGRACDENVDDVAFFDALLAEVKRGVAVDDDRVFVTGMSNGGAMAHRLACERSTVVAAIAPVGGGNQLEAVQGCAPARPVPVLSIHGTDDPCWRFGADDDNTEGCAGALQPGLVHQSIEETVEGWRARNGCSTEFDDVDIDDADDSDADDGMSAVRRSFRDCIDDAAVELVRVDGGGHTWPQGHPYLGEDVVGAVTADFNANELMWSFFEDHPLP